MAFTADDAAKTRFRGTRYAYDRREVEQFRERVITALRGYEEALGGMQLRISELERTQVKGPRFRSRALAADVRDREPLDVATQPDSADTEDGVPPAFERWRVARATADEVEQIRRLALEEARMISAIAPERAAEQIAELTSNARSYALQVTQRAASLATRTEEAARQRVGRLIETAPMPGSDGEAQALNRRMLELRSTIEVVQERLASMAPEGGRDSGGEIISLDLRNEPEIAEPSLLERRQRPRTRRSVRFPRAEDLAAKMVELESRLDSD
jgi:hypothetical protein